MSKFSFNTGSRNPLDFAGETLLDLVFEVFLCEIVSDLECSLYGVCGCICSLFGCVVSLGGFGCCIGCICNLMLMDCRSGFITDGDRRKYPVCVRQC